jgi:exodeoxyribonuclease-5
MTALSPMQSKIIDEMIDWYEGLPKTWVHCNGSTDCPSWPHTHGVGRAPVKSLGGLAGTGKTTMMKELDLLLKGEAVFGTPTHKAAGVLRKKLSAEQAERVRTYHSLVYQMSGVFRCSVTRGFVSAVKAKCTCGQEDACECPMSFLPCGTGVKHECHVTQELKAEPRLHLGGHRDIVIIDESSMLSKEHVEDVRKFGVPVLLVGDHGQLPPIKDPMNPWTLKPDWELTEIHRQGADSGILQAAHDVRRSGKMTQVSYGSPKADAVRLRRTDPRIKALLDRFNPATEGAIITYTNKLRAEFNRAYHGEGPVREGDRVVALGGRPYEAARVRMEDGVPRATGEFVFVHNGMTGTVLKASARGVVTELTVELDDHRLAKPGDPVVILTGGVPTAQFGAEKELPFNSPQRPRGSHLWDYAYALTAHKAQGSEFDKVIVVDQKPPEYVRWLYTALTRAKKAVVVIDWHS